MDKKAKLALIKATNSIRKKFRQLHDQETGQYMQNEVKYKPLTDKLNSLVLKTPTRDNHNRSSISEDFSQQSMDWDSFHHAPPSGQPEEGIDYLQGSEPLGAHMVENTAADVRKRPKEEPSSTQRREDDLLNVMKKRESAIRQNIGTLKRRPKDEALPGPSRPKEDVLFLRDEEMSSASSDISDGSLLLGNVAQEEPMSCEEARGSRTRKRPLEGTILMPAPKKPLKSKIIRANRSSGVIRRRSSKRTSGTPIYSHHYGKNLYSTRENKPNLLMRSEPIASLRKKRDESAEPARDLPAVIEFTRNLLTNSSKKTKNKNKTSPKSDRSEFLWDDIYHKRPKFGREDVDTATHEQIIKERKLRPRGIEKHLTPNKRKLRPRAQSTTENVGIKRSIRARAMSTFEEKHGSGLMEYRNIGKEYVYWDDPNELVERLKLLMASQNAGHTGHLNEINSIIEEMWERRIIY